MRRTTVVTVSAIGFMLLFLIFYLMFEPPVRGLTSLQSHAPTPSKLPTATRDPIPTPIPYKTPSPQEVEAMSGLIPVPLAGTETAGATLAIGPPGAKISISLPMNFQLAGFIISSFCAYPGDLMQYCLAGVWGITDGEYLIYVQPDTGRIFPEAGALESDPHYLQRFQWLIDSLGADKIVDVLWLQEQMRKGWPDLTPIASPTSETAVDRLRATRG